MFLFFSICACKCAILMYSFQSYQFFFSLLFASSLSAFLFIYFLLFVQCRFFFIFFCLLAILCAYICIYKYKYLFVPCLHSRMIFCVPEKIVFLITDFVQCSFHICLCAVSFISFSSFFLPVFIYQSHRQNDDNDEKY